MTYSIIGHCRETGAFGAAIATSNLAVGGRCVRLAHGQGAFLSQHRTDPRLGDLGIAELVRGESASDAVAAVAAGTPDIEWRQLAALDARGGTGAYHGRRIFSIYAHAVAPGAIALGNILANPAVTSAMAEAFAEARSGDLAERLMLALEAGRDAGGEIGGPVRSSALRVTGEHGIDRCDLRIDIADEAVAALRALKTAYGDQEELLRDVALRPDAVPVNRANFERSVARIAELGLAERFPTTQRAQSWTLAD
ncbi:hypothetical protein LNKW23_07840 [Paralimibaculum aggregatum]|uniref:DUF1028 domain-containing protein n=1 Tax=Paralimibaculum aggregatum TaxID=3036245 RepID=A0ABQ6LDZ5_9RHOB|nr:DUF1028 domain-containing protein [Limibaculum sp. NKW23]GMG81571.1 hypothetical protein LNKW23_07840 [Limibaculum sp. NKW23]